MTRHLGEEQSRGIHLPERHRSCWRVYKLRLDRQISDEADPSVVGLVELLLLLETIEANGRRPHPRHLQLGDHWCRPIGERVASADLVILVC